MSGVKVTQVEKTGTMKEDMEDELPQDFLKAVAGLKSKLFHLRMENKKLQSDLTSTTDQKVQLLQKMEEAEAVKLQAETENTKLRHREVELESLLAAERAHSRELEIAMAAMAAAPQASEKTALLEKKTALPVKKTALPEKKTALLEKKNALLEEKTALLEERIALLEEKPALPEEKPALLEKKTALPEERIALLEERIALLEKKPALPEKKPALPEKKPALPEEKPALLEKNTALPEELKTAENISAGNHQQTAAAPDIEEKEKLQQQFEDKASDNLRNRELEETELEVQTLTEQISRRRNRRWYHRLVPRRLRAQD